MIDFQASPYWKDLLHWISERELVRIRRERGDAPPWTQDRIIATTRFTNIRREDDKVTKWIRDNWRQPYSMSPNLAFSMCLARVVNYIPTLKYLGFPVEWSNQAFVSKLDRLQASESRIWTSAYMVTGGYSKGGETKQQIMGRVLDEAYLNCQTWTLEGGKNLQECFNYVQQTPGLGTFLAAQVVADLKYTPLLQSAPDFESFCAPGPGSSMGLNFLAGRTPAKSIGEKQFSLEVNALRSLLVQAHSISLTAHDTQNCLCEFSKYVRIKYLKGRAKNGFTAVVLARV